MNCLVGRWLISVQSFELDVVFDTVQKSWGGPEQAAVPGPLQLKTSLWDPCNTYVIVFQSLVYKNF